MCQKTFVDLLVTVTFCDLTLTFDYNFTFNLMQEMYYSFESVMCIYSLSRRV